MDESITLPDTTLEPGCYVDGHNGQYGIARVISMADDYGFKGSTDEDARLIQFAIHAASNWDWPDDMTDDDHEFMHELADEAETFLNEKVAPESLVFGWHDGEFFLSRVCEDADECSNPDHELDGWTCSRV